MTVAALALPASLAYASTGLSPVIGLYALLLPAVAYALLGHRASWLSGLTDLSPHLSGQR